jgi:DNA-binding transcriptional MerR regulator
VRKSRGGFVRIAELSRESGVAVPTIKYYVREGLLRPGELTSPNQAQYDESHVRRLKLIRALVDVGGLSIAETRDVLAATDDPGASVHETLGKAQYATTPRRDYHVDEVTRAAAVREVDDLLRRRGWQVKATSPARELLAEAISALHALGQDDLLPKLETYAVAAEAVAAADLALILGRDSLESMVEGVAIGTILGDVVLAALRRLAQENASAQAAAGSAASVGDAAKPVA